MAQLEPLKKVILKYITNEIVEEKKSCMGYKITNLLNNNKDKLISSIQIIKTFSINFDKSNENTYSNYQCLV
ncbi:hypothetical protein, partial [Bacillus cereus]|uniref:hypothetical protein n=1 Tax=Bacillus cereus TaxID=1396 RepID=UPI001964D19C